MDEKVSMLLAYGMVMEAFELVKAAYSEAQDAEEYELEDELSTAFDSCEEHWRSIIEKRMTAKFVNYTNGLRRNMRITTVHTIVIRFLSRIFFSICSTIMSL
jgi:hypothetical protein